MIPRAKPHLKEAAYYGLAGEIVRFLLPFTEAHPAALLADILAMFGVMAGHPLGPWPHMVADGAQHPARLNVLVVGNTARARKSTAFQQVRGIFRYVDPEFLETQIVGGFGSGEALINDLAQAPDKRRLIAEDEFSRPLTVAQREGQILSAVMRQAWDGGTLRSITKRERLVARGVHVAVIGHITAEELKAKVGHGTEAANGFLNRFLHIWVERSQILASGGQPDERQLRYYARRLSITLRKAPEITEMSRSDRGENMWRHFYERMALDEPGGVLEYVIARSEAQLLRLSVAYALLDGSSIIKTQHIRAAAALWDYSRASAAYIYGNGPRAELVHDAVEQAGDMGITRTDISNLLGRHCSTAEVDSILRTLAHAGTIRIETEKTGGRPRQRILAVNA